MEFEEIKQEQQEGLKIALEEKPARKTSGPTLRERFHRAMHYQSVDMLPNFEFGYWAETLAEWHKQGLPQSVTNQKEAYEYFGIENYYTAPIDVYAKRICEAKVLEEKDGKVIRRDHYGVVSESNKNGPGSIPHYIDFPIKDRASWEPFKQSMLDASERYPENWDDLVEAYNQRDYPLAVPIGSMIGRLRNLMGFENIALMVHMDPELMEEMVEACCQCVVNTIGRALRDIRFDYGAGWEDICFNSGPIVGREFFEAVVAPRYKRITDLLRLHGVDLALTDCDGNLTHIMPAFLANGMNVLFPVEVNGGTDPVALRRQYGKELRFWGGVDKMIFLKDRKEVDAELERLRPVVEEGGFIPTVDHRVQADAKLDLYKHYLDRKREWFHCGGEPRY
ncbi:hypothetical protein HQ520_00480 [bacterium]|nr:hypothetical protein [bacterium]